MVVRSGAAQPVRGIYTAFSREGQVEMVCNCGHCRKARRAAGEPETLLQQPSDAEKTLAHFAQNGINTVLALIPSEVAFEGLQPFERPLESRKPLSDAITAAHRLGLRVFPVGGWLAKDAPRPELRMVNAEGKRVPFADPGNAACREFHVTALTNLLKHYDFDGVSLDGTRYVEMELSGDCCYCDLCRARLKARYGIDPIEIKLEGQDSRQREQSVAPGQYVWNQDRCENVTTFVRDLRRAVRGVRPDAELSAYVWGYASRLVFQDWPRWLREGLLDWIAPSGYTYGDAAFRRRCADAAALVDDAAPFAITFGPHTSHGRVQDVEELIRQMRTAKEFGAKGYVLFTHSRGELHAWLPRIHREGL